MTRLALSAILLASSCFGCTSQLVRPWGLPPKAAATTFCDAEGQIRSAYDARLFQILPDGTVAAIDFLQEVMIHEAVHRQQLESRRPKAGACPLPASTALVVTDEIQAYCVSFEVALGRGVSADSVGTRYAKALRAQFAHDLPDVRAYIEPRWHVVCPNHRLVWDAS